MSQVRQSATFDVPRPHEKLACSGCAERVCESLRDTPGVTRVACTASASTVDVEFDAEVTSAEQLSAELDRFGAHLAQTVAHASWRVTGLD